MPDTRDPGARYLVLTRTGTATSETTATSGYGALAFAKHLMAAPADEITLRREGWRPPPDERLQRAAPALLAAAKQAVDDLEARIEDGERASGPDPTLEDLRAAIRVAEGGEALIDAQIAEERR